jgi:hypothetical protein
MPGIVLTAGIHPIFSDGLAFVATVYGVNPTVLLIVEVIFFGLVVSSTVQWIYYVYEGFRLPSLTAISGRLNKTRLSNLQAKYRSIRGNLAFDKLTAREQQKVYKIYEYLQDFPLRLEPSGISERYIDRPTRLGNIITTYELYPESRYGIDGVFYWQHLLNFAPDSARKEFDEQYAFAESLLLTSFSGALVGAIHFLILVGFWIGSMGTVLFALATGPLASIVLTIFGVTTWIFFYYSALSAHRDAGASFRAIVDAVMPKFAEWAKGAEVPLAPEILDKSKNLRDYLRDMQKISEKPKPELRFRSRLFSVALLTLLQLLRKKFTSI